MILFRYLASGDLEASLAIDYARARSTTSGIVSRVSRAIWKGLQPLVMPAPDASMFENIIKEFNDRWDLPNCFGAVDGKHCKMIAPPNSGSLEYNYKGMCLFLYNLFFSRNFGLLKPDFREL